MYIMKNHFFFAYAGNKRCEVDGILNYIQSCNFNNIDTIVEPFYGSSALSYYISTKYPNKFNYVLNDFDENLINLYKIVSNETKFIKFNNELNIKVKTIINKEAYNAIAKENTFVSWFIIHKIYTIRAGLYKIGYDFNKQYDFNYIDRHQQ